MSGSDITSILLPASRVDIFAMDDATATQAQKLAADWRFTRVTMNVERSGIDTAIEKYGQSASPELIIVETNDISEAFIKQLSGLAGVCAEGTDAVVIGPKNDVHLYRNLVEMGVKDYLVRPVSEEDMVKVIARTLIEKKGLSGSRLVTVLGSKGGVGTTSVAQMLAWNIAEGLKQKTMLMDVAGSAGSIGISMGLEPTTTMTEALRIGVGGSEDDLKRICQTASEHLSMIVCGGEPLLSGRYDADHIEALLDRIMKKFPVVVIDLSFSSRTVQKRLLARSVEIVMVTTPMLSSLRNTKTLAGELKVLRSNLNEVDVVLNMKGMASGEEVPLQDIKESLGMDPAAVVPYMPKIFAASEATGKAVGLNKSAQAILDILMPLAEKSSAVQFKGEKAKKGGFLDALKKK